MIKESEEYQMKKMLSLLLTLVIISVSWGVIAATEEVDTAMDTPIQFVVLDDDGNEVDVIDLVYIEEVAERYEQSLQLRWASTTYYNLGSGPFTMSGSSGYVIQCTRHFNANSSGRLYYYGEVNTNNAYVDIYDITSSTYKGSFLLQSQGGGLYSRNGYITGLGTGSSQYYSYGLTSAGGGNFTSFYTAISWTAL